MIHHIGIAQYLADQAPHQMVIYGLGSCLGITLYDPILQRGAMAHCLLPSGPFTEEAPAKYVENAIPRMHRQLCEQGSDGQALQAKLVGGAHLFTDTPHLKAASVGTQNILTAHRMLQTIQVPLIAEDTGGRQGRNLTFYLETGEVKVVDIRPQGPARLL